MAKLKLRKAKTKDKRIEKTNKEEKYVKWGWTWKNIIIFIRRRLGRKNDGKKKR
jgi:hypothetical protein